MKVTSTHQVNVHFELPDNTWVGHSGYVVAGQKTMFYLRASSDESPEQARARAREAVENIREAVERDEGQ